MQKGQNDTLISNDSFVIFYADDDEDDLETFKDALQEVGKHIKLLLYNSGNKMLSELKKFSSFPSCIFLDLNMPDKNGLEILEELMQSHTLKEIPVIILSTSTDTQTINKTRQLGASYYIPKPNSYSTLKNAISHVLKINWSKHSPVSDFLYQNYN